MLTRVWVAMCVFGNGLIPLAVANIIRLENSLARFFFFTTFENVYFAKLQHLVLGGTKNGILPQYIVVWLDVVNLHTDCKNHGFA